MVDELGLFAGVAEEIFQNTKPYRELMMKYNCAMLEVKTKLDVLNSQLGVEHESSPFESIHCRIKTPSSVVEKLKRRGFPITLNSIEENLNDVAGIRVICSFIDDIYSLSERLCAQDDVKVIEVKDYIKNPKENGYRSLHLILEIPIFLLNEKKFMRVEVQFRTIAMDFWASLEHKVRYKKEICDAEAISSELKACAEEINALDVRMQEIKRKIDYNV